MDGEPGDPGEEAAQFQEAEVGDGGGAADRRQRAFVAVAERRVRLAGERLLDRFRRVHAFLNRGRRDAGNELTAGLLDRGEIADDENFGMSRDREIGLDDDASGAIERDVETMRQRRGLHAHGPEHRLCGDGLITDADLVFVEARHHAVRDDFHAEALELALRFV